MPLKLEIVTPEGLRYNATADHILLPTRQGQIDILPGHRPLVAMVEPGEIIIGNPGHSELPGDNGQAAGDVAVDRGFVRVQSDLVSVLTEAAIDVASIDESEVMAARERAEAALAKAKEENLDPAEVERLESIARFSIAQQLAKARKGQR